MLALAADTSATTAIPVNLKPIRKNIPTCYYFAIAYDRLSLNPSAAVYFTANRRI